MALEILDKNARTVFQYRAMGKDEKQIGVRSLKVRVMNDTVVYVQNNGEIPVTIIDVKINNRSECTEINNRATWFNTRGVNQVTEDDQDAIHPVTLKVGDSSRWMASCPVIFTTVLKHTEK
jgi:hypothetical protein